MKLFFLTSVVVLLVVAHLLPWAAHKTAALTLSANDLAFFTNFTPGAGIFLNEWFYLPVWVAAILLLGIGDCVLSLSKGWGLGLNRVLLGVFSLGVASLGLPRYEQLITFIRTPMQALHESDFTLQLVLTLLVMGLVVLVALITAKASQVGTVTDARRRFWLRQPAGFATAFVLGLAALLCAVPLAGYLNINPFIAELYRDDIGIGIGWWLTLLADLLLWVMTFATILHTKTARSAQRNTHQPQRMTEKQDR